MAKTKVKTQTLPTTVSKTAETPYEELQTTANQLNYENVSWNKVGYLIYDIRVQDVICFGV